MPQPTPTAVAVMRREVERCLWIARERYGYQHVPSVDWSLRGNRVNGRAWYTRQHIALNAATANAEGENFAPTIGHEVAHLVSYSSYGSRGSGHGALWQSVMRAFGLPPTRCHAYASAVERVTEARIKRGGAMVTCGCVGCVPRAVTAHVASRLEQYTCTKCRQRLVLATR